MTVLLWLIAAPALLLAVGAAYAELTALASGGDDHTTDQEDQA